MVSDKQLRAAELGIERILRERYKPLLTAQEYEQVRAACGIGTLIEGTVVDRPMFHVKQRLIGSNNRLARRELLSRTSLRQKANNAMKCNYFRFGRACSSGMGCYTGGEPRCVTEEPTCGWKRLGRRKPRPAVWRIARPVRRSVVVSYLRGGI